MFKELFDAVVDVAKSSGTAVKRVEVVQSKHDAGDFWLCTPDGSVEFIEHRPAYWVTHGSLESLVAWGEWESTADSSAYWVSDSAVFCETNRLSKAQAVGVFPLVETQAITCLRATQSPAKLDPDALRGVLKYDLKQCGDWSDLLVELAAINWKTTDGQAESFDASRESMGRDIELCATIFEAIADAPLTFSAGFYQSLPETIPPVAVGYHLQILLRDRKYALRPIGDAIAEARAAALAAIRGDLVDRVGKARPVYVGRPYVRGLSEPDFVAAGD